MSGFFAAGCGARWRVHQRTASSATCSSAPRSSKRWVAPGTMTSWAASIRSIADRFNAMTGSSAPPTISSVGADERRRHRPVAAAEAATATAVGKDDEAKCVWRNCQIAIEQGCPGTNLNRGGRCVTGAHIKPPSDRSRADRRHAATSARVARGPVSRPGARRCRTGPGGSQASNGSPVPSRACR